MEKQKNSWECLINCPPYLFTKNGGRTGRGKVLPEGQPRVSWVVNWLVVGLLGWLVGRVAGRLARCDVVQNRELEGEKFWTRGQKKVGDPAPEGENFRRGSSSIGGEKFRRIPGKI